jgi:uncharacterized oxidoreductase
MNKSGNTVLITGGSSGIGMALAQRFVEAGNEVVVTGRRAAALQDAKAKIPGLHTLVSDVGSPSDREALARKVVEDFPKLNVLVNNAGIQRMVSLKEPPSWPALQEEIDINFGGPLHLTTLLVPHLLQQDTPRIAIVSSNLAFAPLTPMPVYCATKAALHSLSQSLRYQLRDTAIRVSEVVPPAVKTHLGGEHDFGEDVDDFADAIFEQLLNDEQECGFGPSVATLTADRQQLDQLFESMNSGFAKLLAARGAGRPV